MVTLRKMERLFNPIIEADAEGIKRSRFLCGLCCISMVSGLKSEAEAITKIGDNDGMSPTQIIAALKILGISCEYRVLTQTPNDKPLPRLYIVQIEIPGCFGRYSVFCGGKEFNPDDPSKRPANATDVAIIE